MIKTLFPKVRRLLGLATLVMVAVGLIVPVAPAQARIFVGIGIPLPYYGPPAFYPPPIYYPPPAYYPPPYYAPPPPVVYTPAPAAPAYAQSCVAGAYLCPLDRPMAPGAGCYCIGNGGERVRGNVQ